MIYPHLHVFTHPSKFTYLSTSGGFYSKQFVSTCSMCYCYGRKWEFLFRHSEWACNGACMQRFGVRILNWNCSRLCCGISVELEWRIFNNDEFHPSKRIPQFNNTLRKLKFAYNVQCMYHNFLFWAVVSRPLCKLCCEL